MKAYRVWIQSLHKTVYTVGYYLHREVAELVLKDCPQTASGAYSGIDEIDIFDQLPTKTLNQKE